MGPQRKDAYKEKRIYIYICVNTYIRVLAPPTRSTIAVSREWVQERKSNSILVSQVVSSLVPSGKAYIANPVKISTKTTKRTKKSQVLKLVIGH